MADEMRKIMIKRFEKQDIKDGFYDVAFKIGDKILHAHRFLLSTVSQPFDAMFSENWRKNSEPIEIKTCSSFEIFKQFIAYFYHGTCNFEEKDIFDIIDLAEMYQVQSLKDKLDLFTSEMSFTDDNIYQFLEVSEIYGFQTLKKSLSNYLVANWFTLFGRGDFLGVQENVLMGILGLDRDGNHRIENALFEIIFAWSEKRAKQKNSNFDNLKLEEQQEKIKAEMTPFLPKFKFGCRSIDFLNDFVSSKSYLFDNWEEVVEEALQNRDELLDDDPDVKFWLKLQILPSNFNNRYHQVLRGLIYSQTIEPVNEIVQAVQRCEKVNGAHPLNYEKEFTFKLVEKLGCYDYGEKYFLGIWSCSVSSYFMLINNDIFRHNENLTDRYKTVCELEGKNFPEFEEEESNFCIQLL